MTNTSTALLNVCQLDNKSNSPRALCFILGVVIILLIWFSFSLTMITDIPENSMWFIILTLIPISVLGVEMLTPLESSLKLSQLLNFSKICIHILLLTFGIEIISMNSSLNIILLSLLGLFPMLCIVLISSTTYLTFDRSSQLSKANKLTFDLMTRKNHDESIINEVLGSSWVKLIKLEMERKLKWQEKIDSKENQA